MSKLKSFFLLFVMGTCLAGSPVLQASGKTPSSHERTAVRGAIDFGSGAVKIAVAAVDTEENRLTTKPLLLTFKPLHLTEDVASHEGRISEEMQEQALNTLREFKEQALAATDGCQIEFTGIATAVFRKAENGNDLLNEFERELGIRFQILSQEEEGKLGFLTAKALYPDVLEENILAWDSGNGSFQLTAKKGEDYHVYEGPLGHGTARVFLSRDVRSQPILQAQESGNPVSREEADELVEKIKETLPPIPAWLSAKLTSEKTVVATFGAGESVFTLTAAAVAASKGSDGSIITRSDVQEVIDTYLGARDETLHAAGLDRKTVTSALYLGALMEHFGIDAVHYELAVGSTAGMLIDPSLWAKGPS